MKKLEVIDYLKGYSIFTIVLMHLIQNYLFIPNVIKTASSLGGAGVHIFILCSGFGLFLSFFKNPISYKVFLKKRLLKVYTPYILIVLVSALFPFTYIYADKIKALFSHIFLFKMFIEKYEVSFGIQFWFVSTIIQLYIIFYILIALKNHLNNNKKFIMLTLGLSIIWWVLVTYIGKQDSRVWNSFFMQYLWEFSLGIILAEKYIENNYIINLPKKRLLVVIMLIGLGVSGISGFLGGYFKLFNDIPSLFGYGSLAILIYSFNITYVNRLFINISKYSYEWYLTHILIFGIVFNINNGRLSTFIVGLIAFSISILVSKLYNLGFNNIKLIGARINKVQGK